MVQDQIDKENIIKEKNISLPHLPEVQPLDNAYNQKLLKQLAESVKVIGDRLHQEQKLNR